MNPNNYSPTICELIAKNIVLSNGGRLYFRGNELMFPVMDKNGDVKDKAVLSLYVTSRTDQAAVYLYFVDGFAEVEKEDKARIWRFVVSNYDCPDTDILLEEEPLKRRLALRERNLVFISRHGDLKSSDIEMVENYQRVIEGAREKIKDNPVPLPGDIVEGAYYGGVQPFHNGLIESRKHYTRPLSICAKPYVPFVYIRNEETGEIGMSVSGGPFFGLGLDDLEYVGSDTRLFCDWGHCGVCTDGAVEFPCKVNRWRVKDGVEY